MTGREDIGTLKGLVGESEDVGNDDNPLSGVLGSGGVYIRIQSVLKEHAIVPKGRLTSLQSSELAVRALGHIVRADNRRNVTAGLVMTVGSFHS